MSVAGYPNYEVSDHGRIRHATTKHVKTFGKHRLGYRFVFLWMPGRGPKNYYVHRLVMLAFAGEPNGLEVNHKNGDKADNRLANLEYVTRKQNMRHAAETMGHGRGEGSGRSKLKESEVRDIMALRGRMRTRDIAMLYKVAPCTISNLHAERRWKFLTEKLKCS